MWFSYVDTIVEPSGRGQIEFWKRQKRGDERRKTVLAGLLIYSNTLTGTCKSLCERSTPIAAWFSTSSHEGTWIPV